MLSGDASINSYIDHIFGKRLPLEDSSDTVVNEKTDTIMLFDYDKEGGDGTRDGNDLEEWKLYIYTSSPTPAMIYNLNDRIQDYLEEYSSDSILLVRFDGDNQNYDAELDIYYNDSEYTVLYSN
jgi:hypothetical protein